MEILHPFCMHSSSAHARIPGSGHRYLAAPTLGLPCPSTIFTFGILLWTDRHIPLPLGDTGRMVVLGFWAAISLGMKEDYGLLGAGLLGSVLITLRNNSIIPANRNSSQQIGFKREDKEAIQPRPFFVEDSPLKKA
ncbi:MAG TPA: DUF6064 family protein [Pyrinomonadaceae bacterium]|nr:DUF6064 family protein [Pyrinomonadaceae bacterium]